ncbi:chymotrypsin-elastase inhibitor ixodidin-like [Topomyia yanbarensis]|uniref:chymotrypsin-elastase inhibitor ixodidin-like n=1 Tax=Topomyia yanbarensis TaxID=2498891 RepID=UPI00273C6712|nr:chymotrypsin-elastase inhibitor ixodidin-like [Topomyia yanbarensis]
MKLLLSLVLALVAFYQLVTARSATSEAECTALEDFLECGKCCENTCTLNCAVVRCYKGCVPGCFCRFGYVRDKKSNKCVKESRCITTRDQWQYLPSK